MTYPAPADPSGDPRYTSARYFALVDEGVLSPDDRVELLEGVIVAMAPQSPTHGGAASVVAEVLRRALEGRAAVREDKPLVLGTYWVPEPDVAIVPGHLGDYRGAHPTTALLVVEVADSSLPQDRITKARMYAAAGIAEYWIVNLRDNRLEIFRDPDVRTRGYATSAVAGRAERLHLVALPGVSVSTDHLLPG